MIKASVKSLEAAVAGSLLSLTKNLQLVSGRRMDFPAVIHSIKKWH
ncbi:hypothetical protein PNH38_00300 [Anoxybacillus rupiensis]|uniref:Transposase n=1 Tax=Anoxybacteroides rupiense TaxID=311460 RepID=A0ABT5W1B8_9BACL|nr:hypothetical protein [Anoxybacillus rupiensis]